MNNKGYTLIEMLIVSLAVLMVLLLVCVVPFWTQRTLEFWLTYLKGYAIHVPFWISFLTTLILNGFIVAINIVSEIIRLAL